MFKISSVVCGVIIFSCGLANAQESDEEVGKMDLGFEAGKVGALPPGWFVPVKGWKGSLSDDDASDGEHCAKLSKTEESEAPFGNLMRIVDAKEYRGMKVKLSAKIRVEGEGGRAMMWLRVDRPDRRMGFFDNMADRPIRSSKWTKAVIEGQVDADAEQFALGVMSHGGGTVFVDEMQLTFFSGAPLQKPSPPRAVTKRGLQNLEAAARLLAYVRFFHPSDEAIAVTNWDHFAVALMEAAEPAEDAEQLAARLQEMCNPIAPSLVVWAGEPADAPAEPAAPAGAKSLRYWVHRGAGLVAGAQSIYSSQRKEVPRPDQEGQANSGEVLRSLTALVFGKDDAVKPPESLYLAKKLGAGVCCRLPVMVYVGKEGSLPSARGENPWESPEEQPRLTALNRSTRLAAVATLWGVMQHFYPYLDVVGTDWDAALSSALAAAAEDTDELAFLHTLQTLVGQLHDGHGSVYHGGVPIPKALPILLDWSSQDPIIIGKHESAPQQVAVGDVVLAINGQSIEKLSARFSPRISAATDGWRRNLLRHMLRTDCGDVDPCPVRLRKPDGFEYEAKMPRCPAGLPIENSLKKPEDGAEVAAGIVYFNLDRVETDALEKVFDKLEAADGIIFDLRGYPGGAAQTLMTHLHAGRTASARWKVPLVTLPDHEGWSYQESAWDLAPADRQLTAKAAFLTDGRAISYAESIMGIVEHYKLGEIVGSTTAGTNGNVNPFALPGGYRVSWTGMKVIKHDGSQHHGVGIQPTVPIEPTPVGIAVGRDEVLEKAIEVLQKQIVGGRT